MSAKDRVRWDKVYRQRARDPYPSPNPLLLEYTPPVDPDEGHTALDLAGGVGLVYRVEIRLRGFQRAPAARADRYGRCSARCLVHSLSGVANKTDHIQNIVENPPQMR